MRVMLNRMTDMTTANPAMPDGVFCRPPQLRNTLHAAWRGFRVACHISYGMLLVSIFPLLKKSTQQHIVKYWSRKLLDILHVGLETQGYYHPVTAQGTLLVANHISWLDAVAMNAVLPAYFVAKSEVGNWLFLGWIFRGIHTLFIKRDMRLDTARINHQVAGMLGRGEYVAVFPEGTTTDGTQLGHFHSSLLQAPVDGGAAICPVAIRYHDDTGQINFDAAFVGDITFIQSLWKILCSPALHVTLVYLPPLPSTGKNRRMLASEAQLAIHTALAKLSYSHFRPASDSTIALTWRDAILPVTRAYFINS